MTNFLKKRSLCHNIAALCGTVLLVFSLLCGFFFYTVFAEECFVDLNDDKNASDRSALERALENCQEHIEETERVLQKHQAERTSTEYDILLIDQEINKALLRIRSSDVIIGELGQEITSKEKTVNQLNNDIEEHQHFLGEVLQRINEAEQKGFMNLLLSNVTISSFFSRTNEYTSLRETMEDSIQSIDNLKLRLTASVDDLASKRQEQSRVRQQQQVAANEVKHQRQQKEVVLEQQLHVEKKTLEQIDEYETRAARIQTRLFELSGGGAISFGSACVIAEEVQRKLGVRTAFLLGLIKHESDLGKNVGTGTYLTDMHPTRDQPIFPYIAKLFGFDPDELRVSKNPGFGWGGAMGPAQFIPSTWVCYGGLVNTKTGTCGFNGDLIKTRDTLRIGSKGADVKRLQKFLNQNGFTIAQSGSSSPGKETATYTDEVAGAVKKFQERYASRILRPYGYTRGTGSVGPSTRAAVNQISFYSGPWQYRSDRDLIRQQTRSESPSNPWNPRDAFFASGLYLKELGAESDECKAARWYYAGSNWRSAVARQYCDAVLSKARRFQEEVDLLKREKAC